MVGRLVSSRKVLVTGAGGFVGGRVATDLEAHGYRVTRVVRRLTGAAGEVLWDICADVPPKVLALKLDVIVHCAANVGTTDRSGAMQEIHVDGTRRVLDAAPHARMIHISTAAVYPGGHAGPFEPADATGADLRDDYARTKWAAEQVVREDAARTGREAVILRPSLIFGEGDRTVVPGLRGAVFARRLWLPDGGRVLWSVTPVELLVATIREEVEALAGAGGNFRVRNAVAAEPVRLGDLFEDLMEADADRPLRVASFPGWLMRALGSVNDAFTHVFAPRKDPIFTRSSIAYVTEARVLSV